VTPKLLDDMKKIECISVFDMLKIGVGPSSSHTLGPWRAGQRWLAELKEENVFDLIEEVKVDLYGSLSLTGKEDAIDEFILYGIHDEKGFAVARILGDNMNPAAIVKLMRSAGKGDINVNMSAFDQFEDLMSDKDTVQ